MQCPHCLVAFHVYGDEWEQITIELEESAEPGWICEATACPKCHELIVKISRDHSFDKPASWHQERVVYPPGRTRQVPTYGPEIPSSLKGDYYEAVDVLPHSSKSSAALSRRILQSLLEDQGYRQRNLADQIDAVLSEGDPNRILPSGLREIVDAVRNFGNFSAHRITDVTSLQLIDVDPQEAEWCLDIIEALFEHYYVNPAVNARKLSGLNAKLKQAGKPPAKS